MKDPGIISFIAKRFINYFVILWIIPFHFPQNYSHSINYLFFLHHPWQIIKHTFEWYEAPSKVTDTCLPRRSVAAFFIWDRLKSKINLSIVNKVNNDLMSWLDGHSRLFGIAAEPNWRGEEGIWVRKGGGGRTRERRGEAGFPGSGKEGGQGGVARRDGWPGPVGRWDRPHNSVMAPLSDHYNH